VRAPNSRARLLRLQAREPRATDVEASLQPALPPFWGVEIHGSVIKPGASGPGYLSAMILWVEPVTGLVIVMGKG